METFYNSISNLFANQKEYDKWKSHTEFILFWIVRFQTKNISIFITI